jgi:hypothetical protein
VERRITKTFRKGSMMMAQPGTMAAWDVLQRFIAEAEHRAPHLAIDSLLQIAARLERDQSGRLTEFQVRAFAAFLLGAAKLPAGLINSDIEPQWIVPSDAELYGSGLALVPPITADASSLTRH